MSPPAIPAIAGAALSGAIAATTVGAATLTALGISAAVFGAIVAVGSCVGPVTITERRRS